MADTSASLGTQQLRALRVLGYLFLRMGQFARARRLFAALAALDPGDLHARCCLAHACIRLEDGEAALHTLTGLGPGDPLPGGDTILHLLRARAYRLIGDEADASEAASAFWKTRNTGDHQ